MLKKPTEQMFAYLALLKLKLPRGRRRNNYFCVYWLRLQPRICLSPHAPPAVPVSAGTSMMRVSAFSHFSKNGSIEPGGVSPDRQVTARGRARSAAGPAAFPRRHILPETKASSATALSNSVTSGDGRGNSSKAQRTTLRRRRMRCGSQPEKAAQVRQGCRLIPVCRRSALRRFRKPAPMRSG